MHRLDQKSEQNIINMLLDQQQLNTEQVNQINTISSEAGKSKLDIAFQLNFTSEEKILNLLSNTYSLPIVKLEEYPVSPELEKLIDIRFLKENTIVPFEIINGTIKIAIPDASKLSLIKNLETLTKKTPELFAASITDIGDFLEKIEKHEYENQTKKKNGKDKKLEQVKQAKEKIPLEVESDVINFSDTVIGEAIKLGASDIHIEAFKHNAKVRYRVDGILKTIDKHTKFLSDNYNAVVTRIKIISKLDIAERRVPQDGGSTFKLGEKEVDLRISIMPTKNNERIVMRVLNKDAGDKSLDELGFEDTDLKLLKQAINAPQGMVLVTGPTGSGKTTTLYSILKTINKPEMNILTAEDPVEYEMEGIGQVQVRDDIGYTFATALRSFLRQDPEVILVGEIRDHDTVEIALKAALTGHLVFSTIHTNDAPSTITRLQNMGTPDYLIAAACSLVMAQRLARKTCTLCRVPDERVSPKVLSSIGFTPEQASRVKPMCGQCNGECNENGEKTGSGYKGRMGIYEILDISKPVKEAILRKATTNEIRDIAKKNGFRTMQDMGKELLSTGDLSFSEFERVLSLDD
jgi:type IV pilus assembly protein PilB